jgi:hypothetical protein
MSRSSLVLTVPRQGASSRRHSALISDAKGLVSALCQLPFLELPGEPAGSEVLSDEQTLLVLALVRQAQETKVPKCAAVPCVSCARVGVALCRVALRRRRPHTHVHPRTFSLYGQLTALRFRAEW